jgi:hypothetical protein
MSLKLADKNKKLFTYRSTQSGAVLTKGKRTVYLTFSSVNQSERAKKVVAKNSFDKLYNKGRKVKLLGSNVSAIDFR